jgi:hypothetical protein
MQINTYVVNVTKQEQPCNVFPKKITNLAGLKPGSSVSQAIAMTTAPRRQRAVF